MSKAFRRAERARGHFARNGVGAAMHLLERRQLLSGETGAIAAAGFDLANAVFIQNQGQWKDPSIRYAYTGPGMRVGFTDLGPVLDVFKSAVNSGDAAAARLSMRFEGAAPSSPVGIDRAAGTFNFMLGDPAKDRSGVPGFSTVRYDALYPGIDLYAQGRADGMKYEFHVAPGANWRDVHVRYDGAQGLSIAADGSLHVRTALGDVVEAAPVLYQEIHGARVPVAGRFVLRDAQSYAFEVTGAYDPRAELIIDPAVAWGAFMGGNGYDTGNAVTTDASGNVIVAGETRSTNWTVTGGYDTSISGFSDAFVVKLSATGTHLWTTYMGGDGQEVGRAVAVDSLNNVLVTGSSDSSKWVAGSFNNTSAGSFDAFVVKLTSAGALVWSTFVGGSDADNAYGIDTDSLNNVVISGETASTSASWLTNAYDATYNGGSYDAFAYKLNANGLPLWGTFLGGANLDKGRGVVVDHADNVLVTGDTTSPGWTAGGSDTSHNGEFDGFLVKLDKFGFHIWSTYMGGLDTASIFDDDKGFGVAVDAGNNVAVGGVTYTSGWITGGYDTTFGGISDGFVMKFSPAGSALWSTYIGGTGSDSVEKVAFDGSGNVLVVGYTNSSGWTTGGYDTTLDGATDGFVVKLTPTGGLVSSGYVGGTGTEQAHGIAIDGASGAVYISGESASTGWFTGGYDTTNGGQSDGFIVKVTALADRDPAPGDANGDRKVDFADLVVVAQNYGTSGKTRAQGDVSGDGNVGFPDLVLVAQNYGGNFPADPLAAAAKVLAAPVAVTRSSPPPVVPVKKPVAIKPAPITKPVRPAPAPFLSSNAKDARKRLLELVG